MKALLLIAIISSALFSCSNNSDRSSSRSETDTLNGSALDSALGNSSINSSSNVTAEDPEAETKRQITEALFSSKKEINELETDISDSLSRSGLSNDRRSLFSKTIRQLETSSDILNKQLEQILVSDLQASREKLGGIVGKMKGSEKELQTMIVKLDRISRFLETATALIQSLSPIKPVIAKPAAKTN